MHGRSRRLGEICGPRDCPGMDYRDSQHTQHGMLWLFYTITLKLCAMVARVISAYEISLWSRQYYFIHPRLEQSEMRADVFNVKAFGHHLEPGLPVKGHGFLAGVAPDANRGCDARQFPVKKGQQRPTDALALPVGGHGHAAQLPRGMRFPC